MESEYWSPAGILRYDGTDADYAAARAQIQAAKLARLGISGGPAQFTSVMREDIGKVGPKGYIHGWIKVGSSPGMADELKKRGFGSVFGMGKPDAMEKDKVAGAHMGSGGKGEFGATHVVTVAHPDKTVSGKYEVEVQKLNPKTGGESGGGKSIRTEHDTADEALARVDQLIGKHGNVHPYDETRKPLTTPRGQSTRADRAYFSALSAGKTVEEATEAMRQYLPSGRSHKPRWEKL